MSTPRKKGAAMPLPITGHALPLFDAAHTDRAAAAQSAFAELWIENPPQRAAMERMEALRISTANTRGRPLPGLRLSQCSQAGKSRMLAQYIADLTYRMSKAGRPANPYQVIYINLNVGVTLKMLCQKILHELGDPLWNKGNTDEVTMRMSKFILARQVELLIVDEVQWLAKAYKDALTVTDQLKILLNEGIVPIVLAGNEDSRPFFEMNIQLASRLGVPLELSPLSKRDKSTAMLFKSFCAKLDAALSAHTILSQPSGFDRAEVLEPLMTASGGHVGRVCRIVEAALENAVRRDAEFVEPYDLALAVERFAIPAGYCSENPFGAKQ